MRKLILFIAMKTFCSLFLIYFLFACSLSERVETGKVITVDLDNARAVDFQSMIDSVTYVPLETIEGNEIGEITRLLWNNNQIIIADRMSNCVFIYKENGKYVGKIDALGNGPREYLMITDIIVNTTTGNIEILDSMSGKILRYSSEGVFIEESAITVSPLPIHFSNIDNEKYVYDFQRRRAEENDRYTLKLGNSTLSDIINRFFPYDQALDISISPRVTLQNYKNEIIYTPIYSSVLYTLKDSVVVPRYKFDFRDKWMDEDFINKKRVDPSLFMNELKECGFVYFFNCIESESHIYADFMYKEQQYRAVYQKEKSKLFLQKEENLANCLFPGQPLCSNGTQFVMPMSVMSYNSIVDEKDKISEENNPILAMIKFK